MEVTAQGTFKKCRIDSTQIRTIAGLQRRARDVSIATNQCRHFFWELKKQFKLPGLEICWQCLLL